MSSIATLEAKLIQSLKGVHAPEHLHAAEIKLRKEAGDLARRGRHARAATIYAALGRQFSTDIELLLRTARSFHKAGDTDSAAAWYLKAAEQYARVNAPAQAAATLRLYQELKPNEHEGPRSIFRLCMQKGNDEAALLDFLSDKDRAGHRMMSSDFFSALDQASFFALLDRMHIFHLEDGEPLMRMGADATSLYFIASGRLEGFLTMNGQRTSLGEIVSGDICGEIGYFTGGRRTAEVVSHGVSIALELPYALLDELQAISPELGPRLEALYRSRMLVKQLSLTQLLSDLDIDTRYAMAEKMTPIELKAGETIFREGECSSDLYMVRKGKVGINLQAGGSEQQLKQLETGGIFGEMAIILNGKRTATARAISDCSLMQLSGAEYMHIYQDSAQLQQLLQKRKLEQLDETRRFIRQADQIEGDDSCKLLLQEIWRN